MTPPPAAATATTPATGLAIWSRRWRQRLPFTLLLLVGITLGIATLLTLIDGGRFRYKLLYSGCIGLACIVVNDTVSALHVALLDHLRRRRGLPPPPAGAHDPWSGVWPGGVVCILLGPALGQALADAITGFSSPPIFNLASRSSQVTLIISLGVMLSFVALISTRERLASARAQAEAAERAAAENQLRLLQSQLEPHMLFNTLANLRVLIGLDAAAAQQMLDRLIAFLRATLEASRTTAHPLATEFERVADYLALMAIRMGPRLQVRLDLPAALAAQPVPPLLLQPLVENAIRHGLEPHVAGGRLEVSARAEGGQLLLEVRDTGVGLAAAAAHGTPGTRFGLAQVRERLATLHGTRAGLVLEPAGDGGGTRATIHLPLATTTATTTTTAPAGPAVP